MKLAVSADRARFFGTIDLQTPVAAGVSLAVGIRNSTDKSLPIGFVGAYTTFSSYEYEIWRLVEMGRAGPALAYVVASNVLGFAAVLAGSWVARR